MNWQIQQAKARFSELVDRTLKEGPQTVTRYGKPIAVVVPVDQYRQMLGNGKSFKAMLAAAPLHGVLINRTRERTRIIDFED